MTRVLFLCTGNSCRSIMAEGLLDHYGRGIFKGASAGSQPTGKVNPLALRALKDRGIRMKEPRSKSWDEFTDTVFDIVITVCDNAAGEACPAFAGDAVRAHWPVRDPAHFEGNKKESREEFAAVCDTLERRVQMLIHLPIEHMDKSTLTEKLSIIGTI